MTDSVRVTFLGGLGEIGMNCLALQSGRDIVLIDCGVAFSEQAFGAEVIRPNFSWLEKHRADLRAVLLTHGHEDHIGALPFLLERYALPVYGPKYALALLRTRLTGSDVELHAMVPRQPFRVGSVHVEPIRVSHSTPDCMALVLRSHGFTVVHSGDFMIDKEAPIEAFDAERFRQIGQDGVDLLLSDSTNVDVEAPHADERAVERSLEKTIVAATGAVFVALFASNVHRIRALERIARRTGRRICLLGRSVRNHVRAATESGYLPSFASVEIALADALEVERAQILAVCSGSQGEPAAALSRIATGVHRFRVSPGDSVIFSSRAIPGNERAVHRLRCALERLGATVHDRGSDPELHVSGHATRTEQRELLALVRPRCFVPVHGTYHHLRRHGMLARAAGVEHVLVVENGTQIELTADGITETGSVSADPVPLQNGLEIAREALAERAQLAKRGVATVLLRLGAGGEALGEPYVALVGVAGEADRAALVSKARMHLSRKLSLGRGKSASPSDLRARAKRAVEVFLEGEVGQAPWVHVDVLELATGGTA